MHPSVYGRMQLVLKYLCLLVFSAPQAFSCVERARLRQRVLVSISGHAGASSIIFIVIVLAEALGSQKYFAINFSDPGPNHFQLNYSTVVNRLGKWEHFSPFRDSLSHTSMLLHNCNLSPVTKAWANVGYQSTE